ncbi:MAG: Na/Pi symporter [Synergistaceae bacterium]|nr:Na/Pi symporter [Synergistaceae bacterium]
MNSLFYAVNILGGLALFLYGIEESTRIFRHNLGNATRDLMSRYTKKRWQAFTFGVMLSAVTQSSTIATSFAVGFVDVGMLSFGGSVVVMMGASLGGTFVSFLLSLDIVKYAPVMFALAFFLSKIKSRGINKIGGVLQGLSIIFLGMLLIKLGTTPLLQEKWFSEIIIKCSSSLIIMPLAACILTSVLQSSSAVVALGISLAASGAIPSSSMLPIAIGVHIGSTTMVLMAGFFSSGRQSTKQLGWATFIYKLAGGIIFIPFIPYVHKLMELYEISASNQLVYGQILLVLANILFLYPFSYEFSVFIAKFIGNRRGEDLTQPRYLDEDLLSVPAISVLLLSKEMIRLADYLEAYLQMLLFPNRRQNYLYSELPAGITELSKCCTEYMYKINISGEREPLQKRYTTLTYTMTVFNGMSKLMTGGLGRCLDDSAISDMFIEHLGGKMWEEFSQLCLKMLRTSMRAFVIKGSGLIDETNKYENRIAKMSRDARRILGKKSYYGPDASQIIRLISILQGLAGMCKEVAQGEEF